MVIMQCLDAPGRRHEIESGMRGEEVKMQRRVITSDTFTQTYASLPEWEGTTDTIHFVQYHPRGLKGGMMPELDSYVPCKANPTPLETRFSPWGPCGEDPAIYLEGMKKTKDLWLTRVMLRLAPGDADVGGAVRQWSDTFGIPTARRTDGEEGEELAYSNCRMGFVPGQQGQPDGVSSVTIGVEGKERLQGIMDRAKAAAVWKERWMEVANVRWYLTLMGEAETEPSKAHM